MAICREIPRTTSTATRRTQLLPRCRVACLFSRSKRAEAADRRGAATAAAATLLPHVLPLPSSPSSSSTTTTLRRFHLASSGLRHCAVIRVPFVPRATKSREEDGDDSDGGAQGAGGAGEGDKGDDAMPSSSTSAAAASSPGRKSTSSVRKTPALEARKAERLRNKLLSMMPDPVDDPLFDAGEYFFVVAFSSFPVAPERGEGRRGEGKKHFFSLFSCPKNIKIISGGKSGPRWLSLSLFEESYPVPVFTVTPPGEQILLLF